MTLNLKTANKFSHMTRWPKMTHHHTKFGYKGFRSYHPDEHSLEFLTFPVTLTVTITDQSNFFDKTTQLMMMCQQTSPCGLICTRWGCCSLLFFLNSVLVSVSVFMTLSTVFHSMNSPNNSPLSHSVLPVLCLPYWSFELHICMKVSFRPDVILCG